MSGPRVVGVVCQLAGWTAGRSMVWQLPVMQWQHFSARTAAAARPPQIRGGKTLADLSLADIYTIDSICKTHRLLADRITDQNECLFLSDDARYHRKVVK